ncbi:MULTISPECIES: outer membrane protein assembly factor BamB family protein [Halobacteriales]|uniref:outer membrane protein assembly factor BamB family protein n=1 Tax=Halobacteriales TaxID=2235 RepID=UPI000FE33CE2
MADFQYSRRAILKTGVFASLLGSGIISASRATQSQQLVSTSFEQASVGESEPTSPWYLFNNGGTVEISKSVASDGDQSYFTGNAPLGDPGAIAVELDLQQVDSILFDVYAVSNDPSYGNIKVSLDEAGYPNPGEKNIWSFNQLDGVPPYGGENKWQRDVTIDFSDYVKERPVVFWVDGDNSAYWDNIRVVEEGSTQNSSGDNILWAFETNKDVFSSPTVVGDTVYIGSFDENTYALDATTGDQKWASQTGYWPLSSPTVVGDTVYDGSFDGNVYALNATTGDQKWLFQTGEIIASSPTVVDGTVFVGSNDNNVYALDAATGNQQWCFETGDWVKSSPTVVEGTVFVGSNDNNVYALDTATGDQEWVFETGDIVISSPTVVEGTVFVGSNDDNVYALEAATGNQEWVFQTGSSVESTPTVKNSTVFVGSNDNNVYALDAATGDRQWLFQTGSSIKSSPTVVEGTVFVGSNDNNVYALDTATGDQEWVFETGDIVISSPTVVEGTVFVGSNDNKVYALDAGVSGSSEGSRVTLGTLGHHHTWADITSLEPLTAEMVTTSISNNFVEMESRGMLESLFVDIKDSFAPPGVGVDPDKNEAYINVDVEVSIPDADRRNIEDVTLTLESDGIEFGQDQQDEGMRRESAETFRYENLRVRTEAQVGLTRIRAILQGISRLMGAAGVPGEAGPLEETIQANTEAYPDVYLAAIEVTYGDGSTDTITIDERLPRYIDVCPENQLMAVNPLNYPQPHCNLDNYTDEDLQNARSYAVLSPASLLVEDTNGNRIGRVQTDKGWETVDEISNVFYSGALNQEFVLVPDADSYRVIAQGTDSGTMTIQIDEPADEDGQITSEVYEDIPVDTDTTAELPTDDSAIRLDDSGDGDFDQTVSPAEKITWTNRDYVNASFNAPPDTSPVLEADEDTSHEDNDTDNVDGDGPGFGVAGAIAGLGGAGYLLKRRLDEEDSE